MNDVQLTPIQSFASIALLIVLMAILVGSIMSWIEFLAAIFQGRKAVASGNAVPSNISEWSGAAATEPQATVGAVDIVVTLFVLLALFFVARVIWLTSVGAEPTEENTPRVAWMASISRATSISGATQNAGETQKSPATPVPLTAKPITQRQFLFSGFAIGAQLLCVLAMTAFIRNRTGCALKKLGWRTDRLAADLRLGLKCFLMMTPAILVINAVLQNVTETPYDHPIQEMIKQYPWLLGIAFWQAAIVAPISEEFGFRVLLVGWFESIHFAKDKLAAFFIGLPAKKLEDPVLSSNLLEQTDGLVPTDGAEAAAEATGGSKRIQLPWWPPLLSGTLFGLAHSSYGVSWISLIVFGIVLGRVYQIRQSVIPVILVHMLFNGLNLCLLALSLVIPMAK